MLKIKLLHPDILMALGSNGHGAKVLIADGNFPLSTCTPAHCKRVFLNLSPGVVSVTEVLKVIREYISIESGTIMVPPDESEQSIHIEFREILGPDIVLKREKRSDFYQAVKSEDTCLAIATGETRRFANILLVIGSIKTI
ncbi:MAG TPA: RbsD/FucU family protein [Cyclobacteriaceae bacterium]|nr:RbsD/FucU family protein [Cyclobacteriaceae bacterium]